MCLRIWGYGAKVKKDPIFESADAAAFELFKTFGSRVSIDLPKVSLLGQFRVLFCVGWAENRLMEIQNF